MFKITYVISEFTTKLMFNKQKTATIPLFSRVILAPYDRSKKNLKIPKYEKKCQFVWSLNYEYLYTIL